MQPPQGLDAKHDGEMFPVAATRVDSTPTLLGPGEQHVDALPPTATRRGGQDWGEI